MSEALHTLRTVPLTRTRVCMPFSVAERDAMRDALLLARRGPRGLNPQVGAVILAADGTRLAEGWHEGAGTSHAEVMALSKLAPESARGATAVVTLEPCNHTGRTGPCAQALIDAGIARVVYAVGDPGQASSGGAQRLRAAGIDVESGLDADNAAALIRSWVVAASLGRPHVTVKWAQSLDGRAAATNGSSKWITGPEARADVHCRRAAADAIVAGIGTVLADDPALTARDGSALFPHQPIPVVIGDRDIPADAALRNHPQQLIHERTHDLSAVLQRLYDRGVQSVFVEGGPTLASAFFAAGLVDDVLIYTAPMLLGGSKTALGDIGVRSMPDAIELTQATTTPLGNDVLVHARVVYPRASAEGTLPMSTTINSSRVTLGAEANVPTKHGTFRFLAYHDELVGTDHLAVISGELTDTAIVRVHSECLTGEAFGSQKCECGPQLEAALDHIHRDGGVVIYLRGQEGRGIGLLNKLRAYALQEEGLDTLDANLALGLPADSREYGAAAAILEDLGIKHVKLLTNNSDKVAQLRGFGIDVTEQVPLVVGVSEYNRHYLETKRDRMGHIIRDGALDEASE